MSVNADKLVQIVPRVMDSGTKGLTFAGLVLTKSSLPPSARVLQFSSAAAVAAYFGDTSPEAAMAAQYFKGYTNTDYLPGKIFFAPWRDAAAPGWLRGAAYDGDIAALKAVANATLTISIDGTPRSLVGINLSTVTSFSVTSSAGSFPRAMPSTSSIRFLAWWNNLT